MSIGEPGTVSYNRWLVNISGPLTSLFTMEGEKPCFTDLRRMWCLLQQQLDIMPNKIAMSRLTLNHILNSWNGFIPPNKPGETMTIMGMEVHFIPPKYIEIRTGLDHVVRRTDIAESGSVVFVESQRKGWGLYHDRPLIEFVMRPAEPSWNWVDLANA